MGLESVFKSWLRRHGVDSLLYLLVASLAVNWWSPWFDRPGGVFDESALLVNPELVLRGWWPFRDFSTFYGPGNFWVLAAFYKVFGISLDAERIVGVLYRGGYLLALAGMGRRLAPRWGWLIALLGVLTISPTHLDAAAWIAATVACLGAILFAAKGRGWIVTSGVAAGASLLFRPDLGLAVGLMGMGLMLMWRWKERILWLLGAALGIFPLVVTGFVVSWHSLWLELFYFPVVQGSPGRRYPFNTLELDLQILVVLLLLLGLAQVATAAVLFLRQRNESHHRIYLAASLLALGMMPQMLQRCDAPHVAMGTLVLVPLLVVTVRHWLLALPIQPVSRACLAVILAFGFVSQMATKAYRHLVFEHDSGRPRPKAIEVTNGDRSLLIEGENYPSQAQQVVGFLQAQSQPEETLYVAQQDVRRAYLNDVFIYHLMLPRLCPGTYFIDLNPLIANAPNSGLEGQLAKCDWVVLNRIWNFPRESNRGQEIGYDGPVRTLATQFSPAFKAWPFTVYRNKRLER